MRAIPEANKEAIGATMYPPLCEICFSLSASMMGVDIRCTVCSIQGAPFMSLYALVFVSHDRSKAYTLLSDCAAAHKVNQQRLREPNILGE